MAKCPHCESEIFERELLSGLCPVCQRRVDVAAKPGTVDEAIEAEIVDDPHPVVTSRPDESSDEFATAADQPPDDEGTVTDREMDRTIDEPAEQDDASSPEKNVNVTVVDGAISQTVDVSDVPLPPDQPLKESDTAENLIDQTMDSVGAPDPPKPGTVVDVGGQTIDLGNEPVIPPPAPSTDDRVGTGTIDSVADDDSPKPAGSGTIDVRAGAPTIDTHGTRSPADQTPGTVEEWAHRATLDSADLPVDVVNRVNHTWNRTAQKGGATINTSLKVDIDEADDNRQSLLFIQSRSFRDEETSQTGLADYDLLSKLGEGGMGMVYAARQASIDRTVAIKMLKPGTEQNKVHRNKFIAEAAVTGDLEHPNIIPIYDLGRNEVGALFYAMKRVKGTPWDEVIKEKTQQENIEIFMKVCDAVGFAHSRGVVHRDLKPENTMLGGYGEVLVMDWGLAVPVNNRPIAGIRPQTSMGGTPAYMAPEMAAGPFDRIGPASDIYLLGAILYEIVTGRPPHTGRDVMKCLFAAARNNIQPTDKTGELVDIAMKAMETRPEDRYESVQQLQDAIRDYLSHSESITLATKATEDLSKATKSKDYDTFSRARFGFQQAIDLWDGNERAKDGLDEASLEYASAAYTKGDFDLGASLLREDEAEQAKLLERIRKGKAEVEARHQRLRTYKRVGVILVTIFLIVVTGAAIWINFERNEANRQREIAVKNEKKAKQLAASERVAKDEALAAQEEERKAKELAKAEERKAKEAEEEERKAKVEAIAAKEREAYEAYVARIGAAAAKIDENAYDRAKALLRECVSDPGERDYRNWEWGRLWYLCSLTKHDCPLDVPGECVAFTTDGSRFATGGWGGKAVVWNASGEKIIELDAGADTINAIAFSPDGRQLALGTDSSSGDVKLVDAETGALQRTLTGGHRRAVLSVNYSADGHRLLTGSKDNTAKVWNLQTGEVAQSLHGHRGWVWDARFCPREDSDGTAQPETKIVTVSQDNMAIVWIDETGTWADDRAIKRTPRFRGHEGPVYAAAFSPDGETVATAGHDKRVLLWKISELEEFDYEAATDAFVDALEEGRVLEDSSVSAPRYRALVGHQASVRSLTFSRTREHLLVSAGHDNTVMIWDSNNAVLTKKLRGHGEWVRGCALSPDGNHVASVGYDGMAYLWDIDGYQEVRVLQGLVLEGHEDSVLAAEFSQDTKQIVTASRDRTIKTWDFLTGATQRSFKEGHAFLASRAVFFADGSRMVTSAVDNTARIWDVATGTQKLLLENTGRDAAIAVSLDGRLLATGGTKDGQFWLANLWDADSGQVVHQLKAHTSPVSTVAFSPSGNLVFTGDAAGVGYLWSNQGGAPIKKLDWHAAKIIGAAFVDESHLVTAASERPVAQWDLATGNVDEKKLLIHPEGAAVTSFGVHPDNREVVTIGADGIARVWDLATQQIVRRLDAADGAELGNVKHISVSPNGKLVLAANSDERTIRIFEFATGKEVIYPAAGTKSGPFLKLSSRYALWSASFSHDSRNVIAVGGDQARLWEIDSTVEQKRRRRLSFSPHGIVASASFSIDGSKIVSGSWDGSARIWDVDTGEAIIKLEGQHTRAVNCATFSPDADSNFVLTASDDGTAILWSIDWQNNSATRERTFAGHEGSILWATFTADGRRIATASQDNTARIWSTASAKEFIELRGHTGPVIRVAFTQDDKWVSTTSEDNSARIWYAMEVTDEQSGETHQVGQQKSELKGHTATVSSVAFSPDGDRLLTGSEDYTAKLWDVVTGKELLTLKGHEQEISSVTFSSKSSHGRYALTGSHDGTAIIWLAAPWDDRVLLGDAN